jgi:recombination protein RecT
VWLHRDKVNKVGSAHYSFVYPEQYARKVVLLALLDYVPRSVEVSQAIRAEYQAAEGQAVSLGDIIEVTEVEEANEAKESTASEGEAEKEGEAVANTEDDKVTETKRKLKEKLAKKENGLLGGDEQ